MNFSVSYQKKVINQHCRLGVSEVFGKCLIESFVIVRLLLAQIGYNFLFPVTDISFSGCSFMFYLIFGISL